MEAPSGEPRTPIGTSCDACCCCCCNLTDGTETVAPREISILARAGERFDKEAGEQVDSGGESDSESEQRLERLG